MSNAARLFEEQKHLIPTDAPVPNRRVLIVDDEPEIAKGIHDVLSPEGENVVAMRSSRSSRSKQPENYEARSPEFDVVVVHNPTDALNAIRDSLVEERPFAMGFFDVMLRAEIDGIELVKQVMELDPRVYAVFVTAYHDRSVDTIGSYLGIENRERWDYINKPFNEGEILQKARNATSLWDLHRLRDWQADRLSEANQLLLVSERQNAAAAIGRSVAHEFGNLLTHIIGHAELALNSEDNEGMKNSLNVILKAGQTAASVLKNFRSLNEANDSGKDWVIIDLKNIVQEALELMEFRFRRHNIKVVRDKLDSVKAEVDKNSIVQVYANLFINAIHAMQKDGEIHLELSKQGDFCHLSIRDTGPGIPEDILPNVTESLFTTKGKNGSGLGLAICKEIIEIEHRGEFTITNDPSGGVRIEMKIPLVQEK